MTRAVLVFLAGVAMASIGQLLLKIGAMRGRNRSLLRSFIEPYAVAGYLLMLASTITSTIALRILPLYMIVSLLPLGYIGVVVLSKTVLGEKTRRHHVWGILVILAGVVVFNLGAL